MIERPIVPAMPTAPATLAEAGLNADAAVQLAAKHLLFDGELAGTDLATRLGARYSVIEPAVEQLKRDRLVEIIGGGGLGQASYRYRLSEAGRTRASLYLEQNQYVGPLPVPLEQYRNYMKAASGQRPALISPATVRAAFSHLVVPDRVLDQIGPAVAARHSLFVYGPPGNGKTVIARAIGNLLFGEVAVPHAIAVAGHYIRVFDPMVHQPIEADAPSLTRSPTVDDQRWVRCGRPMVMVGGELTLESLDLGRAGVGYYSAPLQMIANGGALVIDDFGRQRVRPADLLNRWIVPLESRVDFVRLETGQKFEVPFDVLVIFATNLDPADLVDEAFLRRTKHKVRAGGPTEQEFAQIFENCCRDQGVPFDPALLGELIIGELRRRGIELRGCYPRDLIEHALLLAEYHGRPRALTGELLSAACATYFVEDVRRNQIPDCQT